MEWHALAYRDIELKVRDAEVPQDQNPCMSVSLAVELIGQLTGQSVAKCNSTDLYANFLGRKHAYLSRAATTGRDRSSIALEAVSRRVLRYRTPHRGADAEAPRARKTYIQFHEVGRRGDW